LNQLRGSVARSARWQSHSNDRATEMHEGYP
jgi:hypothetical protein